MKQLFFSFLLIGLGFSSFAQNDLYMSTMKGLLTKMGAATTPEMYQPVANGFERVANAEPKQWLPKYYAAFCYVMQAMTNPKKDQVDAIIDQAEKQLKDAQAIQNNDEIICLQALCQSARIGVDPMTRGMKYGMESAKLLEVAKSMNPENPRIYYLQAQSAFYTPEAFGGGKAKAKSLFETALAKFDAMKTTDELYPSWGKNQAIQMLEECKK